MWRYFSGIPKSYFNSALHVTRRVAALQVSAVVKHWRTEDCSLDHGGEMDERKMTEIMTSNEI